MSASIHEFNDLITSEDSQTLFRQPPPELSFEYGRVNEADTTAYYLRGVSYPVEPAPELASRFPQIWYVSNWDVARHELWKFGDRAKFKHAPTPQEARYLIFVPAECVGQFYAIRPVCQSPRYGRVEGDWRYFHAFVPCSAEDSVFAVSALLECLITTRRYKEVLQIADSVLSAGIQHPMIYRRGQIAARRIGKHADALRLLDEMYRIYGTVTDAARYDRSQPGFDPVADKREYRRLRSLYATHLTDPMPPRRQRW